MKFWTDASANIREPKRDFRFLLDVPAINQSWTVTKVDRPGWSMKATSHTFFNHDFHFPGKVEWGDVKVSLIDTIEPYDTTKGVMQYLAAAGYRIPTYEGITNRPYSVTKSKAVMGNPAHRLASPGNATQIPAGSNKFIIRTLDGEGEDIERWELWNPWISDYSGGDHSYDSEGLITVDLTIKFDWANYTNVYKPNKKFKNAGQAYADSQGGNYSIPKNPTR
jgi:hypothetical protein